MLKRLIRKLLPNPYRRLLFKAKKLGKTRFLFVWNRGMGDVALVLYGLCEMTRSIIPDVKITFLIRPNLEEAFHLLDGINVLVDPNMKRGTPYVIDPHIDLSQYDEVIENPDPFYWLEKSFGQVKPKLVWKKSLLKLPKNGKGKCIGIHVSTETERFYGFSRNWTNAKWRELIAKLTEKYGYEVVLFGVQSDDEFKECNVTDLRGKTSLEEMLSLIVNKCSCLIAPDSGGIDCDYNEKTNTRAVLKDCVHEFHTSSLQYLLRSLPHISVSYHY